MRPYRLLILLALTCISVAGSKAAQQAKPQPSTLHWCSPQIGDDAAHIIGNSCAKYSECLGAVGLEDDVDRPPFTGLSDVQVAWVKKCHQNLYNAARANSQIKGSAATQDWLERSVYPGTAARPLPASGSLPPPR